MTSSTNTRSFEFEVPWYWIPPKGQLRSILLGLHGMAQDGAYLGRKLEPLLDQGIGLILPSGPYPMEVRGRNGARQGHAWYIFTGDQSAFRASMQRSEADLLDLLHQFKAETNISEVPIDLLGFSQGGYLGGFVALRQPQLFRSCIIASARLKHEFLEAELTYKPGIQVLFLHDKNDPLTKADPVEESQKILERAGVKSSIKWHDDGHSLDTGSVEYLAQWLKEFSNL
ncbi:MAG: hypothetical protein CBC13_08920 [Planctomycetia bacterium TMED53]|nr:MAG: hypothetical protein CBC13_08920 [Planctomycetia bacterium TMED53]